jgi:AraC family transcriptional regulator
MNPRMETLIKKKLTGKRITLYIPANNTGELWQSFMQRRIEIQNDIVSEFYSI